VTKLTEYQVDDTPGYLSLKLNTVLKILAELAILRTETNIL